MTDQEMKTQVENALDAVIDDADGDNRCRAGGGDETQVCPAA